VFLCTRAGRTRKIKRGGKYKERRDGPVHIPLSSSLSKKENERKPSKNSGNIQDF
jgi:hypothetical protein